MVSYFTEQCSEDMCGGVYVHSALWAAAVLVAIVPFLLGAIVGVFIHSGYKRHQAKEKKKKRLSGYEEVGLAQDAGQTINLRNNKAYEVHTPRYNIESSQL